MGMIKEFKDFAVKGNAVDMAVGIIVGAAFGKVISSLVNDVIMPPIGLAMGGVDFSGLFMNLGDGTYETLALAREAGAPVMAYGSFIQVVIDFIIVAFCIFMMVKGINSMKKQEEEKPAAPAKTPEDIELLREIRDSLKASS